MNILYFLKTNLLIFLFLYRLLTELSNNSQLTSRTHILAQHHYRHLPASYALTRSL